MRKNRRKEKSRESKYKDGWMGGSKERKEGGRKEKIKSKKKKNLRLNPFQLYKNQKS